ncbi:hypothetical protein CEP54_006735 [Fusarium duplospermum]|uniref:Zn(2)-C6 fungal-type domain-containing protein n=1 Tax=Fusarium duplospermum TaxID=1325734 RepID=A0A428Q5H7_9HYPO|nr:hypothetical protein CEP54_006735 [Fusarium duplospermum]
MAGSTKAKLRTKTGCLTCRQRRKKCDENSPVCGNCASVARECQWPSSKDMIDRRHISHDRSRYRESRSKSPHQQSPKQLGLEPVRAESPGSPCSSVHSDVSVCFHSEVAISHSIISRDLETCLSHHFANKYYSLLLLPSSHPGFHDGWLAEIKQLMVNHKSLYYSVLALAASHIYLIDGSWCMHDLTLRYYSYALTELAQLVANVAEFENHNGLLMSVMLLYIHGSMSWDTDIDVPQHISAASRIITLRLLNRPVGIGRLFDRLAVESVMYHTFSITTGLWSETERVSYDFDPEFWDRAEKLLDRSLFFPGAPRGLNSPVLGVPVSLFRIALFLRRYFSNGCPRSAEFERLQGEIASWEALLLDDKELRSGSVDERESLTSRERYFRDVSYLFALAASLLLEQASQHGTTTPPLMVPSNCWQIQLTRKILRQHVGDDGWTKCFIGNWPIYTLGLFMESKADRRIVRAELERRWELTRFVQAARFGRDLEEAWACSTQT